MKLINRLGKKTIFSILSLTNFTKLDNLYLHTKYPFKYPKNGQCFQKTTWFYIAKLKITFNELVFVIPGNPDAEIMRVPFLKLSSQLASDLGKDKRIFEKQLAELRYQGVRLENAKSLLEVIRERYIHRASHTAKLA